MYFPKLTYIDEQKLFQWCLRVALLFLFSADTIVAKSKKEHERALIFP